MFSSKVWKIPINGSHFGVGIKSFDYLKLASEFVFNKGIKRSTSGFCFASSMCNNLSSHTSLGKHVSLSLLEFKKKKKVLDILTHNLVTQEHLQTYVKTRNKEHEES